MMNLKALFHTGILSLGPTYQWSIDFPFSFLIKPRTWHIQNMKEHHHLYSSSRQNRGRSSFSFAWVTVSNLFKYFQFYLLAISQVCSFPSLSTFIPYCMLSFILLLVMKMSSSSFFFFSFPFWPFYILVSRSFKGMIVKYLATC